MRRKIKSLFFALLLAGLLSPLCPAGSAGIMGPARVQAASVSYKSKYYITTKISKKTLKKGQKAKVTVSVTNSSGSVMNSLKLKATLPSVLKKVSGSLSKTKASLKKNKTYSYSFYVKAKKKVKFKNKVYTSKKVSGSTTKVTVKNQLKKGSKKKYLTLVLSAKKPAATTTATTATTTATSTADPDSYADAMIDLIADLSAYAKKKKAGFAMIPNGGYGLLMEKYNKSESGRKKLISSIDGLLIEDVYYGWDTTLNQGPDKSDQSTQKNMISALQEARSAGLSAFNMEYCTGTKATTALTQSSAIPSVCYTAPSLDLNTIPALASSRVNTSNVTKLSGVKNFMALLDGENYDSKKAYLQALKNTNYDLIFIDLYYDDALTKAEVESLKKKKNGKTRMVCAYLSVGEAEDYRYYWDKSWKKGSMPSWISTENEDWDGNYKVKYWRSEWRNILYGSSDAYLDKILAAGFDGAYLDVIDAYEYFNKLK